MTPQDVIAKARTVYDTLGTGSTNDVRLIAAALKEAYEAGRASVDQGRIIGAVET